MVRRLINILLFGWCGPMTLKLPARMEILLGSAPFQTHRFIAVSHWSSMCWLISANFDEELPKQEDICDTAKDTEYIVTYLVYSEATMQVIVNYYLY